MIISVIITIILLFALIIVIQLVEKFKDLELFRFILTMMIGFYTIFVISLFVSLGEDFGYEKGQKHALKGIYKYEMKVNYQLKDSTYVPVDTVFIELKK
jgi:hypothetical protein